MARNDDLSTCEYCGRRFDVMKEQCARDQDDNLYCGRCTAKMKAAGVISEGTEKGANQGYHSKGEQT